MTTIPYDRGWHAKIDGHPVKCQKAISTFLALKIKPGTHQVTLHYRPPFLITGMIISVLSLLATSFLIKLNVRHQ